MRFVDHDQIVTRTGSVATPDEFILNVLTSPEKAVGVGAAQRLEREQPRRGLCYRERVTPHRRE
jgi:hypothetical protein